MEDLIPFPHPESWEAKQRRYRDAAWRALYGRGADPFGDRLPPGYRDLAVAIARAMVGPAFAVMDDMDVTIEADRRERVLAAAVEDTVRHTLWAITSAIGDELARAEPEPFSPPPAGSWVRVRWLPSKFRRGRERVTPEWDGMWHVYSGDFRAGDTRMAEVTGRARCGARLRLRSRNLFSTDGGQDHVVADGLPAVDACKRCNRPAS